MQSRFVIDAAAEELREVAQELHALVAQLTAPDVWSGPDSTRFASAWESGVIGPLLSAAGALDALAFVSWAPIGRAM